MTALVMQLAGMSWQEYWQVVTHPQVVAAYRVTLLSAAIASVFNGAFGMLMAWVLTRYRFPGRNLLDGLMDLPFALPTAVAGLTLASLFSTTGWYGQWLAPLGIKVSFTLLRYCSSDGVYQYSLCRSHCSTSAGRARAGI